MQETTPKRPSYEELETENLRLKFEIINLKKVIFGQRRERFIPAVSPEQMIFSEFDALEEVSVKTEQISYTRSKRKRNHTPHARQLLPAHLPRKEIVIEPEEDITGLKKIGEEVTEELEFKPGKFYVNRFIRPKYALPEDAGVIIGNLPTRPIEKGIAGPGLLAHILIGKFVDHLPLYRQRKQFLRQKVDIPETTLYGWVKSCYTLLWPLYEAQKSQVLGSDYLMVDETPIKVLDPGNKPGTTHQGYYWVYYDPVHRQVFFDYRPSRSREGPNEILAGFSGYIQTDGYTGYEEISRKKDITPVGCMAHARRYFVEAENSDPERANWMLHHLQILYRMERHSRDSGFSHDQRFAQRISEAAIVMNVIKDWLDHESLKVLPKSAMGKAIGYMLNQWPRLERYITDGRLEIDNNPVENAIRPVALGRKNYLFAGSHSGAEQAALIYTMVSNAKLQNAEPFEYLRDVISRISDHPHKLIDELLACNWKPVLSSEA